MSRAYHLAQVNVALAREPLDAPLLADFMAALAPVNARADQAPGFVWRMQDETDDATSVRGFGGSERLIINMSIWTSLQALREFVYRDPDHVAVMRRRRTWFDRLDLHTALWWVPATHRPDVPEAEQRLAHLNAHGPTPYAFSFRSAFPPPDQPDPVLIEDDDRWLCPA